VCCTVLHSCILDLRLTKAVIDNLMFVSPNRGLLYVTDMAWGAATHKFEHLSCFLPGVLALGTSTLKLSPRDKELHQWAAEGLAYTCWIIYADTSTGLAPEGITMQRRDGGNATDGRWVDSLKRWESGGRVGGVPPGLVQVPPTKDPAARDYKLRRSDYLLRPEVVISCHFFLHSLVSRASIGR
jgi:mannosyl-oligosaccharide alpha-1,2-mannosidase